MIAQAPSDTQASARRLLTLAMRLGFEPKFYLGEDHILLCIEPSDDSELEIAIENDGSFGIIYNDVEIQEFEPLDITGTTFYEVVAHMKRIAKLYP